MARMHMESGDAHRGRNPQLYTDALKHSIDLESIKKTRTSLVEVALRAAARKTEQNLRHVPEVTDVCIVSEHTKLMAYHQYQTMKSSEETTK